MRPQMGLLLLACLASSYSTSCSVFCQTSAGSPLFLTPLVEKGAIDEAKKLSRVGELPGASVKSYAGYLTVNKQYNSNLFFWFFPALKKGQDQAPLLLWLQGGPGSSSMIGVFIEHGPYVVFKNLTVGWRKYAWTSRYSIVYIDSPVGTGFSFTDDDRGFTRNQDDVGRDLYSALTQFFQIFPEYQSNDFYVTGESYAGKYVPAISYYIHKNNPTAEVKMNLKGMAIGDGMCDPEMMLPGYGEFMYQTGLISEHQRQYVDQQTDVAVQLIKQQKWTEAVLIFDSLLVGNIVQHPTFFNNVTGCTNIYNYVKCQKDVDLPDFNQFVTLPAVRRAIHVGNVAFADSFEVMTHIYQDILMSVKPWLGVLMDHYRVLIYNGQLDMIVAVPLTERFLLSVEWTGAADYKNAPRYQWKIQSGDAEVAGYVRQVGEFYQVIIRGGGHFVIYDQPARTFDMIDRFLSKRGWQ
ncbi:probable serine carboxypeptidase CPVL [Brachionichthys hirsutus]|uniref:probable serine carboxypeptidase CPVL n=1 Tax=Brachionichthys hirsutus TaxID=412623 RepID=UPI003604518F